MTEKPVLPPRIAQDSKTTSHIAEQLVIRAQTTMQIAGRLPTSTPAQSAQGGSQSSAAAAPAPAPAPAAKE